MEIIMDMLGGNFPDSRGDYWWVVILWGVYNLYLVAGIFSAAIHLILDVAKGYGVGYTFGGLKGKILVWSLVVGLIINIPFIAAYYYGDHGKSYNNQSAKSEKNVKVKNHRELPSTMKDSPLLKD